MSKKNIYSYYRFNLEYSSRQVEVAYLHWQKFVVSGALT